VMPTFGASRSATGSPYWKHSRVSGSCAGEHVCLSQRAAQRGVLYNQQTAASSQRAVRGVQPTSQARERAPGGTRGSRAGRRWRRGPCRSRPRDWSHCRFVRPFIRFIPDSLTYSVPLFLKRQCDRTLGPLPRALAPQGGREGAPQGESDDDIFSASIQPPYNLLKMSRSVRPQGRHRARRRRLLLRREVRQVRHGTRRRVRRDDLQPRRQQGRLLREVQGGVKVIVAREFCVLA